MTESEPATSIIRRMSTPVQVGSVRLGEGLLSLFNR